MENTSPGKRFLKKKINHFEVSEYNRDAFRFVKRQIEDLDDSPPDSIFFHGDPGTGKTWLMAEIWKAVRRWAEENGHQLPKMLWVQVTDLVSRIREEMNSNKVKEIRKICKSCDILFLDDLGTEHTTDWVLDSLVSILDHRYREMETTCITTNKSSSELSARYGDAFISRIVEMCHVFELSGKDRRIQ